MTEQTEQGRTYTATIVVTKEYAVQVDASGLRDAEQTFAAIAEDFEKAASVLAESAGWADHVAVSYLEDVRWQDVEVEA